MSLKVTSAISGQTLFAPELFSPAAGATVFITVMPPAELFKVYRYSAGNWTAETFALTANGFSLQQPIQAGQLILAQPIDRLELQFCGPVGSNVTSAKRVNLSCSNSERYLQVRMFSEDATALGTMTSKYGQKLKITPYSTLNGLTGSLVTGFSTVFADQTLLYTAVVINGSCVGVVTAISGNSLLVDIASVSYTAVGPTDQVDFYRVSSLRFRLAGTNDIFVPVLSVPQVTYNASIGVEVRDTVQIAAAPNDLPSKIISVSAYKYNA